MVSENLDTYRQNQVDRLLKGELAEMREWYERELAELGEMTVEDADLTDGDRWKATLTENGQVDNVDGAFFTLKGTTVTRYNKDGTVGFQWTQPCTDQKQGDVILPTPDGLQEVRASGFVGVIMDKEGNVLLGLGQEPYADTPKKALIRTPFQTSTAKLNGLLEGKRELDPNLYDILQVVGAGRSIQDMFQSGVVETFPLPYADANRIKATNIGFTLTIADPDVRQGLTNNGHNRWFSQNAVNYTAKAGLLNGHMAGAILASRAK